jgi:hypothetical protein
MTNGDATRRALVPSCPRALVPSCPRARLRNQCRQARSTPRGSSLREPDSRARHLGRLLADRTREQPQVAQGRVEHLLSHQVVLRVDQSLCLHARLIELPDEWRSGDTQRMSCSPRKYWRLLRALEVPQIRIGQRRAPISGGLGGCRRPLRRRPSRHESGRGSWPVALSLLAEPMTARVAVVGSVNTCVTGGPSLRGIGSSSTRGLTAG